MQIKEMFEKKIDRDIKGVIKVGQSDEENVYQELDEYVVTKELLKHFRDFFDNYEKGINNLYKLYLNDINTSNKDSIIYKVFLNHQAKKYLQTTTTKRQVIDFIAGMTDDFLIREIEKNKSIF